MRHPWVANKQPKNGEYDNNLDSNWRSRLQSYRSVETIDEAFRRSLSRNFDLQPKRSFQNLKGFITRKLSSQSLHNSSPQDGEHFPKHTSLPFVFPIARPLQKKVTLSEVSVVDSGYFDISEPSTPSTPSTTSEEETRFASLDYIRDADCIIDIAVYPLQPKEVYTNRNQVFRGIRAAKNVPHMEAIAMSQAARMERVNAVMRTMTQYQKYSSPNATFPRTAKEMKHVQQVCTNIGFDLAAQVRSILGGTIDLVDRDLEKEAFQQSIHPTAWKSDVRDIQIAC
ncbi:hypothetical protein VKS41_007528 [Umbelopsis sp. WA50703]